MNELLDYIESYFEGRLAGSERKLFEERIIANRDFAQEVAFYLNARQALHQELAAQKTVAWKETPVTQKEPAPVVKMKRKGIWAGLTAIAASVAIVLYNSLSVFSGAIPQQLAKSYADSAFSTLNFSMGDSRDSLQQGIEAYNHQQYDRAEKLFSGLYAADPQQKSALKFSGLVSLQQKDYDKAISRFEMLAHLTMHANPGLFYEAITLLQRDQKGDKEKARKLLEQVVAKKQVGKDQAAKWLQKF